MQPDADNLERNVRFRPSRVDGMDNVDEVRVTRDVLQLFRSGQCFTFPFLSFAPGREISSGRVPVGELHFSRARYQDSHFVFYTTPRIAIYMPADGPTAYPHSDFWRVQEILIEGGLKLYDDGLPKVKPRVLDPKPSHTILLVLAVLGFGWLYVLAGLVPAPEAIREFLLSNPHNPHIGMAFALPAILVPLLLAFRHARSGSALAVIIASAYAIAMLSEWAIRQSIHSWAPLEQPPFNSPFWSRHRFVTSFIVVAIAAIGGLTWRRAFLEPIRPRPASTPPA